MFKVNKRLVAFLLVGVALILALLYVLQRGGWITLPRLGQNNTESPNYARGQLIVSFNEDLKIDEAKQVLAKYNLESKDLGKSPLAFTPDGSFDLNGKDFDSMRSALFSYTEVDEVSQQPHMSGFVSVRFKQNVGKSRAEEIAAELGLGVNNIYRSSWGVVSVPAGEEEKYIGILMTDPSVTSASLNFLMVAF